MHDIGKSAWSGRSFVAGVGSTLAALALVIGGFLLLCNGGGEHVVSSDLASPSGENRAILYTEMGGGAAGWCDQRLAVVPAGTAFNPTSSGETLGYVFSVGCGSKVVIEWLDERRLKVLYSVGSGTSATLFPRTEDGTVVLEYAVQK